MITEQTYIQKVNNKSVDKFNLPLGDLIVRKWWVGTEQKDNSSMKVQLFFDEEGKGNKNNWQLIDVIYTAKATYEKMLQNRNSFHSNGKSKLIVEQEVLGQAGKRETFVRWQADVGI